MIDSFLVPVLHLWPIILMAAVPLAFTGTVARLVFLMLGLILFFAIGFSPLGFAGLHGEGMVIAFPGLAISAAAILAEVLARAARVLRR
jgi:hypothetical protein